jgi:glycosyltransferase involved in cell wall biosynthesis
MVGFVGSLKPWHGLPILVEAFARLHRTDMNTRLRIVGDGPERRRLENDLDAHGVRHAAVLTGAVAPAEVPGLLASMDVAVAPYPAGDHCYFSPLKVYEYMAAGLPVVASRIGQLVEVIRDDINGLLCHPGDAVDFAGAFIRLRSEPALRSRLGTAARATVATRHTWAEVARRILDFAGSVPGPRVEVGR